jgi:beta-xylosidase
MLRSSASLTAPVVRLRVRNDEHDVSILFSGDGRTWTRFETGAEVSGFHHESFSGWGTLRVALYAAGAGEAAFSDFRYRGFK